MKSLYLRVNLKDNAPENPTREILTELVSNEITNFYGITHEVEFDKIKRDKLAQGVVLSYSFEGEPSEDSIYNWVYALGDMDLSRYSTATSSVNSSDIIFHNTSRHDNFHDLSDLQTIYLGMKYDERKDPYEGKGWDILRSIVSNKVKKALHLPIDGSYPELQYLKFKLEKLEQFNPNKYNFVNRRLKRTGKTLSNFQDAANIWDRQYKKTLNLDRSKASMELQADLALSGLNDNIV